MAKRRPRLVPKVVFRVALTATAIPLATGCHRGSSELEYGPVAQQGFVPDASPKPYAVTDAGTGTPADAKAKP